MLRKKVLLVFVLIIGVSMTVCLDEIVNWGGEEDPAEKKQLMEKELYNEYGLRNDGELSDKILYYDDQYVWYEDRILQRFRDEDIQERSENISGWWGNFSSHLPEGVRSWMVPIPNRILCEEGYEDEKVQYDRFRMNLKENLGAGTKVVDLYPVLKHHEDEYVFYRTADSITNRGAYYAAEELLYQLGVSDVPKLSAFHEAMYQAQYGDIVMALMKNYQDTSHEYRILRQIPLDLTCLYTFPDSKNYCEVYIYSKENGKIISQKQPLIVKSKNDNASVIASRFDWAVAEGDGESEKGQETLLLIGDGGGRSLLPILTHCYDKVYYINLEWNKVLGAKQETVESIFENYNIHDVLYVQNASRMGLEEYSSAMRAFWQ